ncbi:MAG: type II toxin-antitoxin system HicA family toxin [Methylobacillus sp.]|nr:type II toxin-antitoxin system HicA family toxin [Methylobacillus sp.]
MNAIIAGMNSKQRKTLEAVFATPTHKTLEWTAIESLLKAIGCDVIEGNGSRVRFVKDLHATAFHRPHPSKEAKAYQVEQARDFLILIGVTP